MTPVARLSGLPKGLRLLGGVQFSPGEPRPRQAGNVDDRGVEAGRGGAGARLVRPGQGCLPLSVYALRQHDSRSGLPLLRRRGGRRPRLGLELSSRPRPPRCASASSREVQPGLANAASRPLTSSTFETAFAWERRVRLLGLKGQFDVEKIRARADHGNSARRPRRDAMQRGTRPDPGRAARPAGPHRPAVGDHVDGDNGFTRATGVLVGSGHLVPAGP